MINEFKGRINRGVDGNIIMIIIVVKFVFFVILIILGEVSGFFIIFCIIELEIVKLLFISNFKSVLGIWYLFKIKLLCKKKFVIVWIGLIIIDFIYRLKIVLKINNSKIMV